MATEMTTSSAQSPVAFDVQWNLGPRVPASDPLQLSADELPASTFPMNSRPLAETEPTQEDEFIEPVLGTYCKI